MGYIFLWIHQYFDLPHNKITLENIELHVLSIINYLKSFVKVNSVTMFDSV